MPLISGKKRFVVLFLSRSTGLRLPHRLLPPRRPPVSPPSPDARSHQALREAPPPLSPAAGCTSGRVGSAGARSRLRCELAAAAHRALLLASPARPAVEAAGDAAVRIQVRLLKADVQRLVKGSRADPPGLSTACSTWRRCAASACARARSTRMQRHRRCCSRLRTAGRGGHRGMPPEPLPSGLAAAGSRRRLLGSLPPVAGDRPPLALHTQGGVKRKDE